ncbi:hypothetical protein [Ferrimonas sp. YFM]|uniref:hypothetical protein n=1 Tax=Ferrimonas sp. YFM TaxID=3028878 RepID=UPI002573A349|nr:hypothetical protein [Ferrimonas sp. YFM]BDY04221.1 hypothetical protein F0521_12620 [Ferrimonas sp. YFM]
MFFKKIAIVAMPLIPLVASFGVQALDADDYEMVRETFGVYNWTNCSYQKGSGEPNFYNLKGGLQPYVPRHYKGLTATGYIDKVDTSAPSEDLVTPYKIGCYQDQYLPNAETQVLWHNYRPKVSFTYSEDRYWSGGVNKVTFTANATDYDGYIEQYTWYVNGVKQVSTNNTLTFYTFDGGTHRVSVRAQDNGRKFIHSSQEYWYNFGEPAMKLTAEDTREVVLSPWSCLGRCDPL